jgi:excisionase family DNA binding protein
MAKISLVSRRHRETTLPETAAQRRARQRESDDTDACHTFAIQDLTALSGPLSLELPDLAIDDLLDSVGSLEARCDTTEASQDTSRATIRLALSPEQSQIIEALPYLAKAQDDTPRSLTFDLTELHGQQGVVLQFSLHHDSVPEMLSLKDLCHLLKVGRRAVLRLIHQGHLRCYRIGTRYRFAADDVKHYLEQISSE